MSHDHEAKDAMAKALHEVACPCGGWPCQWEANPDDPTDEAAEISMARYRRDAPRMLRHLAAAGYTVTRGRYEPLEQDGQVATALTRVPGLLPCLMWASPGRNEASMGEPLYRKIEGSTDGR